MNFIYPSLNRIPVLLILTVILQISTYLHANPLALPDEKMQIIDEIMKLEAEIQDQELYIPQQRKTIGMWQGYIRDGEFNLPRENKSQDSASIQYRDAFPRAYSVTDIETAIAAMKTTPQPKTSLIVISYILQGLSALSAIPGPLMEMRRNYIVHGIGGKPVLWSSLLWPYASSIGNSLYLTHLAFSQKESVLQRIINGIPATLILIPSVITTIALTRYTCLNGLYRGL